MGARQRAGRYGLGALSGIVLNACATPVLPPLAAALDRPELPAPARPQLKLRAEPPSRRGNPDSYTVFGKRYQVRKSSAGYRKKGHASWYGPKFHGRLTSSGEPYDMHKISAAHKSLPIPTYVKVTRLDNGHSIVVRVNDRGPFIDGREIDLSLGAAEALDMVDEGTTMVEVVALAPYQQLPGADADAGTSADAVNAQPGQPRAARVPPSPALAASSVQAETHQAKPPATDRPAASVSTQQTEAAGERLVTVFDSPPPLRQTGLGDGFAGKPLTGPSLAEPPGLTGEPRVDDHPSGDRQPLRLDSLARRAPNPVEQIAPRQAGPRQAGPRQAQAHAVVDKPPVVYLQIAAYRIKENAEKVRQLLTDRLGYHTTVHSDDPSLYRIRIGPLGNGSDDLDTLRLQLSELGFDNTYLIYSQ